jgi:hypothetical protein
VPVVCVTGAFTLTPMFAHNQSAVLNQLLSPADALPYNANINVNNVEVTPLLLWPLAVYRCMSHKRAIVILKCHISRRPCSGACD